MLISPARLQQIRELRGWTGAHLARTVSVSPQMISSLEAGAVNASTGTAERIAAALGVPLRLLSIAPGTEPPAVVHYRRSTQTRTDARRVERRAQVYLEVLDWISERLPLWSADLPDGECLEDTEGRSRRLSGEEVEERAAEVRQRWGLGAGPVENLTAHLEGRGIILHPLPPALPDVGAFCFLAHRAVIATGDGANVYRWRVTLAHEVGHLVMHAGRSIALDRASLEWEANRFAAALLLPAGLFRSQVPRFTGRSTNPERWLELKALWGVPVDVLLYRARALGVLTDAQHRSAMVQHSQRRWRQEEPDLHPWPAESPRLPLHLAEHLSSQHIWPGDLAQDLPLGDDLLQDVLGAGAFRAWSAGAPTVRGAHLRLV